MTTTGRAPFGTNVSASSPAMNAACELLDSLVSLGVRHVVLSPGSRSQALALAAADLERQGRISLHVRIDERVAGFMALGIGRETRVPAAVICTSGTAVANLLPATLEAFHSGVPLLLLTADRPLELRGVGANQATDQPGIFGDSVRLAVDAPTPDSESDVGDMVRLAARAFVAAAGESVQGPVHLNLPFREPLGGAIPEWFASGGRGSGEPVRQARQLIPEMPEPVTVAPGPRTVVVAGADAGSDAEVIAHQGRWPLIAEVVSGARFGRRVVNGYREALRDLDLGGRIERVIVVGHPTLARETAALLSNPDVEIIAVRGTGEPLNLNGKTVHADAVAVGAGEPDREWNSAWSRFSRAHTVDLDTSAPDLDGLQSTDPKTRLGAVRAELDAVRTPLDRVQLVAGVWRATWPHDRLMFASSRLVRVADEVLGGKRIPVHANRGLAGIDGTIATGLGIALAARATGDVGVTRILTGDLAFLHDVGALLIPAGESATRVQVVVGNDGGGTIFDGLEVAKSAGDDAMRRVQYTPQSADLAALASAYGWEHVTATTRAQLDEALTSVMTAPRIIEVPLTR
ncbi:2-succinyl-5-enolpyruvyl-6-hydroxy-3-cyclohexene-1-carboxylic-acid synthase [Microbacterium amylolyticum]|uniref:2-succinyl-5-enolpyruvyl-6-hydroxy-3- cyclohexene-1-carboxylic-acid synthase n=1 Tax=Microbacterium amylolyticum TaxID=936337 RepID=UPI0013ECCAB5|nr:2-succinyl-5-enolpyruvyl-6-hydroxy-3-cyclohexene-1-carboxylic-acid synthase [Microbacterium amylolyticum]